MSALFINGIHERVLSDIGTAQERLGAAVSYLQPHSDKAIRLFRRVTPSLDSPVRLYASTTGNLSKVSYTAEIIGWDAKGSLSSTRRREIRRHIAHFQPGELNLFDGSESGREGAVNLLTIRNLHRLEVPFPTSLLRKISDGEPLKTRTRAGGWSEVSDAGIAEMAGLPTASRIDLEEDLQLGLTRARGLTPAQLQIRLNDAQTIPERIQVTSMGFRRNPDAIIAVLRRANGVCEDCGCPAPFTRRSDGTPFLEVHHKVQLSQGGEDTVANAVALCPNCHRRAHFG